MSLEAEIHALRLGVALTEEPGRTCLRLSGPGAAETVERLCPRELFLRDGQMLHTLFLGGKANPEADVYVCADGEDFLLLCEGMGTEQLLHRVAGHAAEGAEVETEDLTATHALLTLSGPYAWELLSEVISPEVIGLPYLGFFHGDGFTCFRAGKTGEFSYDLLLRHDVEAAWRARIQELGAGFELRAAGAEAVDLCALENFFFNMRRDAREDLTPVELQLQWRVSYRKSFAGSEVLLQRRSQPRNRAVLISSQHELAPGDQAFAGNAAIGSVLHAAYSFDRRAWLGLALMEREHAYAGLDWEWVSGSGSAFRGRCLSAPAINNRSLYVDPQRHSYQARSDGSFPPLVLELPR